MVCNLEFSTGVTMDLGAESCVMLPSSGHVSTCKCKIVKFQTFGAVTGVGAPPRPRSDSIIIMLARREATRRISQALDTAYCTLTHHIEALRARRKTLHLAMTLHKGAQAESQVLCDVIAHAYCQPRNHCQGSVLQAETALMSGRDAEDMAMLF